MILEEIKPGESIKFKAYRITKGNPVSGELISQSAEWVDVRLDHDIVGLSNIWEAGEIKSFRKSLITVI